MKLSEPNNNNSLYQNNVFMRSVLGVEAKRNGPIPSEPARSAISMSALANLFGHLSHLFNFVSATDRAGKPSSNSHTGWLAQL